MAPLARLALMGTMFACTDEKVSIEPPRASDETDTDTDTDADTEIETGTETETETDTEPDTGGISCANAVLAGALPLTVNGNTSGQGNNVEPSCAGAGAPDYAYEFTAPADALYAFDTIGTNFDTTLYVYDACFGTEIACNDDSYGLQSQLFIELAAGQSIILVVDGFSTGSQGPYILHVTEIPPNETDCADGIDEDIDQRTDCIDPDCSAEPNCSPLCPDLVLGEPPDTVAGTTLGMPDENSGSCAFGAASPDASIEFTAPQDGRFVFELTENTDFYAFLYVLDGCSGPELDCGDLNIDTYYYYYYGYTFVGGIAVVDLLAAQTVLAVVDGYNGEVGDFEVTVHSVPSTEASACSDLVDNDYDNLTDCYDPDCTGELSCIEICDSQIDEDVDGRVDCLDDECLAEPGCTTICPEEDANETLPFQRSGDNLGAADDFAGSCGGDDGSDTTFTFTAPADGDYTFDTVGSIQDTVLYVLDGDCTGVELACNDNRTGSYYYYYYYTAPESELTVTLSQDQTVIIVVDSASALSGGAFVLRVYQ